jgi:hypothetical protein
VLILVFRGKVGIPGLDKESVDQILGGFFESANCMCACSEERANFIWLVRLLGGLVEDIKESLGVLNLRVYEKRFVVLLKGLVD